MTVWWRYFRFISYWNNWGWLVAVQGFEAVHGLLSPLFLVIVFVFCLCCVLVGTAGKRGQYENSRISRSRDWKMIKRNFMNSWIPFLRFWHGERAWTGCPGESTSYHRLGNWEKIDPSEWPRPERFPDSPGKGPPRDAAVHYSIGRGERMLKEDSLTRDCLKNYLNN